ncbi:MAG: phosphoglycerate mutase (2,3-diphosphoglycerate-independent) [Candidatus Magasanikbacteria bacterium RIFCSPHIGHO2_02_FULL_41_13]|uniref:2,3-bisphosphoglycerate-independent phosphoglycerate mutase n=1 Tax=Candidatus Magasanikbacteria bacterium RIFCSPHIGHO2_02_FULL_41_13 TaxID=1798676 RepID=A0A1F6M4N6_9BACT|nr:MAG: phosphoglycerate mutase (2,3-diphosphoglycerate-independent) [Candidatus Magasanikbacteria bacterium RIFCSPHIGHO2_02_FULL_41_13]
MSRPKPLVLAILDGFGVAPDSEGNAITRATTPNWNRFIREYPVMTLMASGSEVGLSFGEMGNSEVGHLNIGAGRVYYQTFPLINKSIQDGSFFENTAFVQAAEHAKSGDKPLHLLGLVSPGNVHASQDHLYALLEFCKRQDLRKVYVHVILDGRDTIFNAGIDFVRLLDAKIGELGLGKIATVSGRYYAMDRDNRWERIQKAYIAMTDGRADVYAPDAVSAVEASYAKKVYDEEFIPTVIGTEGNPTAKIENGDSVIFFNFRPDRARQLAQAFVVPGFSKFDRVYMKDMFFVTMAEYEKELPVTVAFPPQIVSNCLAEVISRAGLKQFHIAETEKYAHVTFFLNGTREEAFPGEDRKIIPSPKVASYDLAPEMSAAEIVKETIKVIQAEEYDVIFLNFANPDMVGHTGNMEASVKAVEAVDRALGTLAEYTLAKGGVLLITADHGNAEEVKNLQTGEIDKEHSTNSVPFMIIAEQYRGVAGPAGDPIEGDLSLMPAVGMLADVAPTILRILELEQPPEMSGRALI